MTPIKAVLLDLDDTLLGLETDQFVRRYVDSVTRLLVERIPELAQLDPPVSKAFGRATRAVIENLDPVRNNLQVFSDTLSALINMPIEGLIPVFNEFYGGPYLEFRALVKPIPIAPLLIDRLLDMGMAVAIATNPVFPREIVNKRLTWGELASPRLPYAMITTLEISHFTKPNPHYYEEILTRLGVEADEAIMVGDNFTNDILAAGRAGLNTFWIDQGLLIPEDTPADLLPDGKGTLGDFAARIEEGWLETLNARPQTIAQIQPRMLGSVGALAGLVETMNPDYWHKRPDPNEWSPLETVCHLRDSERSLQRPRLERILTEDNPFISAVTSAPGPGEQDLSGEDGIHAFREFWEERCQTLTFLNRLDDSDWKRPARHSIFGPTTLLEMAQFTTRHDHLHIKQLCQTIGRCGED